MTSVRVGLIEEESVLSRVFGADPRFLQPVLESIQEGIQITDNRGNIIFVNRAFADSTGTPAAEWVGRNVYDIVPLVPLVEALASRQPLFNRRSTVEGIEGVANAIPILVEGQLSGGVMSWQPLNQNLRLQDELNQSGRLIENLYVRLEQAYKAKYNFNDIIGTSKVSRASVEVARKTAKSDSPVLIIGEAGTGKELYAHAIHNASRRRGKPFVKFDCTAIEEGQFEEELFGHEKSLYPGAAVSNIGCLEMANGGTLFLDEVANLNLFIQDKILRFLEHSEFFRVGGYNPVKVDIRLVASTNRDLASLVREGKFRERLLQWLCKYEVNVPSLRQRREDIPLFMNDIILKFTRKLGKTIKGITPQASQVMMSYDWPGNVRELAYVLESAMLSANEKELTHKHLSEYLSHVSGGLTQVQDVIPMSRMEEILLRAALAKYGDNLEGKKKAAKSLNISLATLYNKLKKYEI